MDRPKKPSSIPITSSASTSTPRPAQPRVSLEEDNTITAALASGDSVAVNLFGATVTSWKRADGGEQLFLSEKAAVDGSRPVRGGIPIVFPVFGPPPAEHPTSSLPQHGFARSTFWEYLGKSASETAGDDDGDDKGDDNVKLNFGLSSSMLRSSSGRYAESWPYDFSLVYSVTLGSGWLETTLQVQNTGKERFDFQVLLHTYFRVEDISRVRIENLASKEYIDKVNNGKEASQTVSRLPITGETDRVYKSLDPKEPIVISEAPNDDESSSRQLFSITRELFSDVVVWNPWATKARGMADFAPDDGYKQMVCVEAGSVSGWQTLDRLDSWECGQRIRCRAE